MADSEVPEVVYELDSKVYHGKMSVPDALEQAYSAGMRAGEIARKKLEAIVEGALAAEGMLSPCSICRPSDEHRHEENCPILDAERFLSKVALPAAPEEKKP